MKQKTKNIIKTLVIFIGIVFVIIYIIGLNRPEQDDSSYGLLNTHYIESQENISWIQANLVKHIDTLTEKNRLIFETIRTAHYICVVYSLETDEWNCVGKRWRTNIAFFNKEENTYRLIKCFGSVSFGENKYLLKPETEVFGTNGDSTKLFVKAESFGANQIKPKKGYLFKIGKNSVDCIMKMHLGEAWNKSEIAEAYNSHMFIIEWTYSSYDNVSGTYNNGKAGCDIYVGFGNIYFPVFKSFSPGIHH